MNTYHDFNAETLEDAKRRKALASVLQQVEMLPNEQYKMPSTSNLGISPEMMMKLMKKNSKAEPAPVSEGVISPVYQGNDSWQL